MWNKSKTVFFYKKKEKQNSKNLELQKLIQKRRNICFEFFIENLMYMNCLTSQQNKIFANHIMGILNIKDILNALFMMR